MMFYIVVVVSLTLVFLLTLASVAWQNIVLGVLIATVLVLVYRRAMFPRPIPSNGYVVHLLVRVPVFMGILLWEIIKGTWVVALIVLGLRPLEHPGIVKIYFGHHSANAVGLVSQLLTISPGSFLVDVDWEDRTMLMHYMDASDPAQLRADADKYFRLLDYDHDGSTSRKHPPADEGGG